MVLRWSCRTLVPGVFHWRSVRGAQLTLKDVSLEELDALRDRLVVVLPSFSILQDPPMIDTRNRAFLKCLEVHSCAFIACCCEGAG